MVGVERASYWNNRFIGVGHYAETLNVYSYAIWFKCQDDESYK